MPKQPVEPTPHENRTFFLGKIMAIIGIATLIVSVIAQLKKASPTQSIKTKGDNSPAQAAQTSGSNSPAQNNSTMGNGSPIFAPNNSPNSTQVNASNLTMQVHQDYIKGTSFTYAELDETFPFGYTVFFHHNRTMTYDAHPSPALEWKIDPKKVKITPDFAGGRVQWELPDVSATKENSTAHISANFMAFPTSLQVGKVLKFGGVNLFNEPTIHVMVLSASQAEPVFAIGYRIARRQ